MKSKWIELRPQVRQVWRLSLPAILSQITTIVMQYIDSAMVGALGAQASAAIGLVTTSTWLLGAATYAVSAGFSVQVAHNIGGGKIDAAKNVVRHGLVAALVISGLLCTIGVLISGQVPAWLGGDLAIRKDASQYFMVFALALPFWQMNTLCSSFLQCSGDMVTPSILNATMCVLDVVFNAIFIPMYGVLGAGIGTGLSYVVVSLLLVWRCCFSNRQLRLVGSGGGSFNADILKKAFHIGMPVALQEVASSSAMVAGTVIIAPLGPVTIAAHSFAVTAESLCYMPGYGIGAAATTLVGRCIGAGDTKMARRYGNICVAMGGTFMGLTGLLMAIICPLVFTVLTPDVEVQNLAAIVLRIGLLAEPLFGVAIVSAGALRGTGDTLIPSLMYLSSIWLVRIGLAVLIVPQLGLRGMWIAMAIDLCVRGMLLLYRQRTSKYYRGYTSSRGAS